jgi:hypothetical protein
MRAIMAHCCGISARFDYCHLEQNLGVASEEVKACWVRVGIFMAKMARIVCHFGTNAILKGGVYPQGTGCLARETETMQQRW